MDSMGWVASRLSVIRAAATSDSDIRALADWNAASTNPVHSSMASR